MISFENVSFSYASQHPVLADVSTEIQQGEFVCVLGPNGSGKSTFVKLINALLLPIKGKILVDGIDTASKKNRLSVRSLVGMVFQNPDDQLVASIVEDEIAFGPENLGIPSEEIRHRVQHALDLVQMTDFAHEEVASLSGGQKQRIAVAGAIAMNPSILVLDEASSMLDPRGRKDLLDICRTLNEDGTTIVMVTHSIEEALWGNRCLVLDKGKIAYDGAPEKLVTEGAGLSLGLDDPFAAKLSRMLIDRGLSIPLCTSDDQLVSSIISLSGESQ